MEDLDHVKQAAKRVRAYLQPPAQNRHEASRQPAMFDGNRFSLLPPTV
ncbi:hypothetical protein NKH98_31395 [Mesorhizobium sp. M0833]